VLKTRRRNPSREQFWRDTIRAWKASGKSVRAFCATRGLNEATFYARRRELADRVQPTASDTPSDPPPTFAAVRVIPDPTVEVVLPTGLVLRVPVGVDPAAVARLVAALGGQPCSPSA
jgi:transposase